MTKTNNVPALEQAIMRIARQEAQTILDEAHDKAAAIRAQAQAHAEAASAAIRHAAEARVPQIVEQAAAKAQMEAQMLKLQRREEAIERAFTGARQRLATLPQRAGYAAIARHLLDEAITLLDSDTCIIHADAQTQTLLTGEFLAASEREHHVTLRLGEPLADESGPGIVLTTPDGRRRYDNTFTARLTRIQDSLRAEIYHVLAGDTA